MIEYSDFEKVDIRVGKIILSQRFSLLVFRMKTVRLFY
jgi:hypothetical protein